MNEHPKREENPETRHLVSQAMEAG